MALARRMAGFTDSPTLRVSTIARTLRAQGRDVVDFGSGEPDFDTPEHIKQAAVKALHEGFTKYTTPSGIDELKDAIVDKLKRDNGLLYRREQVVVSCGAKHTLHNLAQVLFDPGDEVILPSPYWTTYETIIQMAEAVPVIIPTTEHEGFRVSLDTLEHQPDASDEGDHAQQPEQSHRQHVSPRRVSSHCDAGDGARHLRHRRRYL